MPAFFIYYGVTFGGELNSGLLSYDLIFMPALFCIAGLIFAYRKHIWVRLLPVIFVLLDAAACGIAFIFIDGWDALLPLGGIVCDAEAAAGVALAWVVYAIVSAVKKRTEKTPD